MEVSRINMGTWRAPKCFACLLGFWFCHSQKREGKTGVLALVRVGVEPWFVGLKSSISSGE